MRSFLPHVASRVFGSPLLIQPRKLDVILRVLGPRIGLSGKMLFPDDDGDEDPTDRNPYTITPDGIAVISVAGSLVRKSSFMDAYSGITSYADIETEFLDAVTNPSVKGILLDIDSPGGECAGCFDLADAIYALRGSKPIYAIANESMFSAAYALGSAADKIFVTRTGGVGSIGVICLHVDQSGMDAQEGLKFTPIYAGDHKNDFTPHEPLADDVKNEMQGEVDRLYTCSSIPWRATAVSRRSA
jgi:ClpP class serine protease